MMFNDKMKRAICIVLATLMVLGVGSVVLSVMF